jgi:hypothetical protein
MNPDARQTHLASSNCVLSDEILSYLASHPEAQDTLEGIAEWWLLKQRVVEVVGNLETVLYDLVSKEFVLVSKLADGRLCYQFNRKMEKEVRKRLRDVGTNRQPQEKPKCTGT